MTTRATTAVAITAAAITAAAAAKRAGAAVTAAGGAAAVAGMAVRGDDASSNVSHWADTVPGWVLRRPARLPTVNTGP